MTKKYRHHDLLKILVVLGGIVGILEGISIILGYYGYGLPYLGVYRIISFQPIVIAIACLIGAVLALVCGLKPDDPIPFHWLMFLIFAIWLIVCGGLFGGVLCLIAFLIGLIDELS